MNVAIVHACMIKAQVLNVDTSVVIVGLQVQLIIAVGQDAIHLQAVEMTRCIIDTIDIRNNDHIQRSVFFRNSFLFESVYLSGVDRMVYSQNQ